jgi:hypothetical protein
MLREIKPESERQVSHLLSYAESRFLKRWESRRGPSWVEEGDQWEGGGEDKGG